ncbi:hypothetical protein ABID08_005800 [Rhizobium binae]|uniref:Transcriptional regulator n=1 Tax=Rhizobium binae TaxID=1138190 RepID=A0ABV2MPM6_9HYPH|nr:hypothetical protein [Rhizobium binae]MBX4971017.1 hypothetical protein [Rhizobium binae]MBX4994944.1 hypothetical protein [Rhizobium binae]NKL52571.1 hypothetical protein [Rhizobium leguminosarum bv. viciae]QSY85029.1 hypothetical protein J2J99_25990 [Rhizobium binae]
MKIPQRKFVVEFKSGRRRSTTQPDSIWGNTDLRAFVRQAETEAPHLFESKLGPEDLGQPGEMLQDQQPGNQPDDSDDANQNQPAASLTEPVQIVPSQNDHGQFASTSQSKKRSIRRPARITTRIDEKRSRHQIDGAVDEGGTASSAGSLEAPIDELAALDAENRHLKALLIKHLHQENLQLRKMLERFGLV